ncbi:MAG: CCC motif membrane protein [Bacteroidota bacterium]
MSDDLLDPHVNAGGNGGNKNLPNATAVLVLGICSIVGCILYGIPSIVCGIIGMVLYKKDKPLYDANPALYELSHKNAKAGYICSIIGLIIGALFLVFVIIYVVFAVSVLSSAGGSFNRF